MKAIDRYCARLKERYEKLYNGQDCKERVEKDIKEIFTKGVFAASALLIVILLSVITTIQHNEGLIMNSAGEIAQIVRPDKGEDAFAMELEVDIKSKEGIVKKKYQITVEPVGKEEDRTAGTLPEHGEEEKIEEKIRNLLGEINENTEKKMILLPGKLDTGETLSWKKAESTTPVLYLTMASVLLLLGYKTRFYRVEREEREAKQSIIRELPEFINKLVLLLNAGSVLNTAFIQSVDDFQKGGRKKSYFYEQLAQICRTVEETNGVLHDELKAFAKRSGVRELMRITNIISDNINKGADLSNKLREENDLLWFSRKQQSEEKGRLAETKLTLPLMILLLVLIMVTIAPALMEI